MAGSSIVGALRWVLGADTVQLEKDLDGAKGALRGAAAAGQAAGDAIVGAFTKVGGAIAGALAVNSIQEFAVEFIKAAAAIGRFAEQAGLTTQQFQGLQGALSGAGQTTEQFAAGMGTFSRNLSDLSRGSGTFLDFIQRFAPALEAQFKAAQGTQQAFGLLTDVIGRMGNAQDRLRVATAAGGETFARFVDEMLRGRSALEQSAGEFRTLTDAEIKAAQDLERRWNQVWFNFSAIARSAVLSVVEALGTLSGRTANTVADVEKEIQRVQAMAPRSAAGAAQVEQQLVRLRQRLQELKLAADDAASAPPPPTFNLETEDQKKKAQEAEKLRLQGLRDATREWRSEQLGLMDDIVKMPSETLIAKLGAIDKAYQQGIITQRQKQALERQVNKEQVDNILSTASLLASTLTTVFAKNKTAAIAAAIINTAVGITRALQLPPPFSWAQAALIAATGAAQIAAIKSTNVGGGGSAPSVSGGGGGAAEQAAPSQTLTVQGIDPNALFSGEAVRNLAQRLLDFQADGGQVVLK